MLRLFVSLFILVALAASEARAREMIIGPVSARVLKVQDGDTLVVLAKIWPGHEVKTHVRIRGIDAPEMKARCPAERSKAFAAKDLLTDLINGKRIHLHKVMRGKYFGRVLANVSIADGTNLEPALLQSGLVRTYKGRKRKSWCIAS